MHIPNCVEHTKVCRQYTINTKWSCSSSCRCSCQRSYCNHCSLEQATLRKCHCKKAQFLRKNSTHSMICFASFSETSSLLGSRSIFSSASSLLDSSSSSYRTQKKNRGARKCNIFPIHTFSWHSCIASLNRPMVYDTNLNHKVQLTHILQQNCTSIKRLFLTYSNQQEVMILQIKNHFPL